ncbi:DUF2125 domain-containing protein [Halocynthiibacter styelae]|uniref:DUF2125 domain-containing protein n=1 Tax=Halocynthiibacter styelae TaxID=2761955 RepID=A0A8J7ICN6_9RHOB|nr:DUF2125 domain-containing protein [Paenihalocynthiibacter styelae]MBI1493558.1 DUF2125 domain-containing protein [Paenihalocynthiibacter styelae]
MRALIIFILCVFIGWGGYWVVGSMTLESQLKAAFEEAGDQGIDLQYSEFGVQGFPNRFDTVMRDVDLKIPAEGVEWQAPLFVTAALSYKPWHLIATWPQEQSLRIGDFSADILTEEMQASVVFEPDVSLPLDRSQLVAKDLRLTPAGTSDLLLAASEVFIATRQAEEANNTHDLLISLKQILLPQEITDQINPDQTLPVRLNEIRIDSNLELAGPVNREGVPPLRALDLREAKLTWGAINITLNGRLTPDSAGQAQGQLALKVENWREAFQVFVTTGLVQPGWEGALTALTLSDGNPDTLEAPLNLQNGQIFLGPFPLGTAPLVFSRS